MPLRRSSRLLITLSVSGLLILAGRGAWIGSQRNNYAPAAYKFDQAQTDAVFGLLKTPQIPDRFAQSRGLAHHTITRDISKLPDGSIHHRAVLLPSNTVLYDVTYELDAYGRRGVRPARPSAPEVVVTIGASEIWGTGLTTEETFPSLLASKMSNVQVVNLGGMGAGTNDNYKQFSSSDFKGLDDIHGRPVRVFYFFQSWFLQRLVCPISCYQPGNKWLATKPHYEVENGQIVYKGTFEESHSPKKIFLSFLAKTRIFEWLSIDWPSSLSSESIDLTFRLFNAMNQRIARHGPLNDKVFVILPPAIPGSSAMILKRAASDGVHVLDLSRINLRRDNGEQSYIPVDGHPTAYYNDLLAQLIQRYISDPTSLDKLTRTSK